jgi:hypothetical protein
VQVIDAQISSDYLCDTHRFISVSLPFVVFASSRVQSSYRVLVDFKTCILHPWGHVHNNSIATSSSQTIVKLPKMFSTLLFPSFVFHQAMNPLEKRAEIKDLLHPFRAQDMHPNCASLIKSYTYCFGLWKLNNSMTMVTKERESHSNTEIASTRLPHM